MKRFLIKMDNTSDKNTSFSPKRIFDFNGKVMDFTSPRVMGIVNVTPDSFYDGGREAGNRGGKEAGKRGSGEAGKQGSREAGKMMEEGAYMIDIGAVSTRPGATEVNSEEERKRLLPVLRRIRKEYPDIIISIDTYRAEIARIAAGEGADMINDISGGTFDPLMIPTIAHLKIPYIIMHIQGTPSTMQLNPVYKDVVKEVGGFLTGQARKLRESGHDKVIVDPGFGFGKTVEHNYLLLQNLDRLVATGYPVLAGLSRKSMINRVLNIKPEEALNGTTVLNTIALLKGASILRVHDVRPAVEAIRLVDQMNPPPVPLPFEKGGGQGESF
jgi:dihydropteroate synthase